MNKHKLIKTGIATSCALAFCGMGLFAYSKRLDSAAQSKTAFPLVHQKETLEAELTNTSFQLYSLVSAHTHEPHRQGNIPFESVTAYTARIVTLTDAISSIATNPDYDQQDRTVRALKERSSTYGTLHNAVSALGFGIGVISVGSALRARREE